MAPHLSVRCVLYLDWRSWNHRLEGWSRTQRDYTRQVATSASCPAWMQGLRPNQSRLARLLELIGEQEDVRRLRADRQVSKEEPTGGRPRPRAVPKGRGPDLGRGSRARAIHCRRATWSQELNPSKGSRAAVLLDLDRSFSATTDQVLDALWPDLTPDVAANSLNQTLYFLRRVFEEDYAEDLSPGYFWHDSDLVWLDAELVRARAPPNADRCFAASRPDPPRTRSNPSSRSIKGALPSTSSTRSGPRYRDSLHASYLEIVERSVQDDFRRWPLRPGDRDCPARP